MNVKLTFLLIIISTFTFAQDINQFDSEGKRHGVWKKNFEGTKQIRYQGTFEHGKEVGEFKFYKLVKKKSILTATKLFNANDNSAEVKFLASNGKVISEGKMVGKLYVGKWVYYHNKSNKIMTLENYNDKGELEGEKLVYYKEGEVAERANFVAGKQHGKSLWYSVKGVVLKEFMYDNGELHGIAKYYNPKAELLAEGKYERGKKIGVWKYYEDGKLTKETNFSAPKKKEKQ
ncbi:toxin-antitoxin system YwqK family antitoxin [Flavobacteriaceae bacterium S0862]|jgi:antitoxin component YwqK of YwqJK toxin-antitoxin module|nr:toxin-antitoxin system YwqK family antitoxin [Flavobacteriaceae bacterium S0862]